MQPTAMQSLLAIACACFLQVQHVSTQSTSGMVTLGPPTMITRMLTRLPTTGGPPTGSTSTTSTTQPTPPSLSTTMESTSRRPTPTRASISTTRNWTSSQSSETSSTSDRLTPIRRSASSTSLRMTSISTSSATPSTTRPPATKKQTPVRSLTTTLLPDALSSTSSTPTYSATSRTTLRMTPARNQPTTSAVSSSTASRASTVTETGDPCVGPRWTLKENWNSLNGILYPAMPTLADCQLVCLMNIDCLAMDYDTTIADSRCWLHVDASYLTTGSASVNVNQYSINHRQCVACFGAHWVVYANHNSLYAVVQSDISTLLDCQRRCINDESCVAVDFTHNTAATTRCWLHTSDADTVDQTRDYFPGTWQYVIVSRCNGV